MRAEVLAFTLDRTSMWLIYVAVAVDLTAGGLMIGAGTAVSMNLAIALAAGQVLADVPEGYATVANFRDKGVPRRRRILLSASFILVGAALISYAERGRGREGGGTRLRRRYVRRRGGRGHAGGGARGARGHPRSVLAFVGGLALFTLVSAGLETAQGSGSGTQDRNGTQREQDLPQAR